MLLSILFAILYLRTDEPKYQAPLTKCLEATYSGSDIKQQVEAATDGMRKKHPVLTTLAPIGYAVGIKREFRFTSSKVSLPNAVTSYQYDQRTQAGAVTFTWRY